MPWSLEIQARPKRKSYHLSFVTTETEYSLKKQMMAQHVESNEGKTTYRSFDTNEYSLCFIGFTSEGTKSVLGIYGFSRFVFYTMICAVYG